MKNMCLNPILIKNVNYGNKSKLNYLSDSTAQFIPVPCGRCSVCLQLKQQYLVQRVQMESLSHDLYFGTLTYNDESLPSVEVGEFKLNYCDISDWQKMIKMIRKHEHLPDFSYFLVTEYGGRRHRPHYHFILSFPKDVSHTLADRRSFELRLHQIFLRYWRRNYGSTRSPIWKPLCTYKRTLKSYNFDLHYLDPRSTTDGLNDVAFYASKYCLKFDKWFDKLKSKLFFTLPESDYISVLDKIRPRLLMSKGFGSPDDDRVVQHIRKGIDLALSDPNAFYPYFISPVNGQTFPLAPYYSNRYLTLPQQVLFNSRKPTLTGTDMMLDSETDLTFYEKQQKEYRFDVVRDFLYEHTLIVDDDFDDTSNSNFDLNGNFAKAPLMAEVFADSWKDFESDCDFDDPCNHDLL